MSGAYIVLVGLLASILTPFGVLALYRRVRLTGSLVVQEGYRFDAGGCLLAGRAVFDPTAQVVHYKELNGVRQLSFAALRGLVIQVGGSRKVHLGLLLADTADPLPLGTVVNHDLKQAGINGHQVAQVVAGRGVAFLHAYQDFKWSPSLIGSRFEFYFGAED